MKNLPLSLAVLFGIASASAQAQVKVSLKDGWSMEGIDPAKISYNGKHVTSYNPGLKEGKPFFYPVIGPTGENMTRHWPMKEGFEDENTDHIHHRGMWYGLGNVNGLDFWHYAGDKSKKGRKFGIIRQKALDGVTLSKDDLKFRTRAEWLNAAEPEKRVMSDEREFRLFYTKGGALVVDAKITLIADAGDVTINDDKEGAWSIRTIPTLRLEGKYAKGNILNSEGVEGKPAWGKRASWVDYFGVDRAGNSVGIAIFDHPSNPRHPTWWHARHYGLFTANPFGQGNFEKGSPKDAGNYTIKSGESLSFQYRTIFHKGDASAAGVAEAYEEFSKK